MGRGNQHIEKPGSAGDSLAVKTAASSLDSLRETLTVFQIPSYRYSILHDKDGALCLTYDGGKWLTYASERGSKSGIKFFTDVEEACFDLMRAMVLTDEDYAKMKEVYLNCLGKNRSTPY